MIEYTYKGRQHKISIAGIILLAIGIGMAINGNQEDGRFLTLLGLILLK